MKDHLIVQNDTLVESIECDGQLIATIIRAEKMPDETEFVTGDDVKQQVGFVVYPEGGIIPRHVHVPMERHLRGTSEVLVVRKGMLEADFYTDGKEFICTRLLRQGDVLLLVSGGHGFRCLKDTVLLEVKQGPYLGPQEKQRF
ncbi:MAG TPA: hypothetical protein PKB02_00950 [Anaerohalosphaeraceae bacterium]|nr:hypothetical protein [Anaerohalosphaeraceae bacterium]